MHQAYYVLKWNDLQINSWGGVETRTGNVRSMLPYVIKWLDSYYVVCNNSGRICKKLLTVVAFLEGGGGLKSEVGGTCLSTLWYCWDLFLLCSHSLYKYKK